MIQCDETGEKEKDLTDENLPLWVPDLHKSIKPQLNNLDPEFDTDAGTSPTFDFVCGRNVLQVKGILFDTIDGLSGTRHWEDDFQNIQNVKDSSCCSSAYGDNEAFREATWKAAVGDGDSYGNAAPSFYKRYVLDAAILDDRCAPPNPCPQTNDSNDSWRWNLHLWMKRNGSFVLGGKPFRNYFQSLGAMEYDSERYYEALGRLIPFKWSRRLATTERG